MSGAVKGNKNGFRHGHCPRSGSTPEHQCWHSIKSRCLNPKHRFFKYYGALGVTICDRWRNDFAAFLADVGPRPSPKHSIDRFPDNNGNYEPGNVRWATATQQIDNRRSTILIEFRGERISRAEACRRLGLNRKRVNERIRQGWSLEEALTPPLFHRPNHAKQMPGAEIGHRAKGVTR